MRRSAVLTALVLLAAPATAAHAQSAAQMDVAFAGSRSRAKPKLVLGHRVEVRGILCPYAPGQRVRVRFKSRGKVLHVAHVTARSRRGSRCGHFSASVLPHSVGPVFVRAEHAASPAQVAARTKLRKAHVVAPHLFPGDRGVAVRLLQAQLRTAGYVVGRRGVYDDGTARAVLAFHKLSGLPRVSDAPPIVFRRLAAGGGRFAVRYPDHGHHVEADLSHQVLALIDDGRVQRIYPISSGAPATPTVLGSFHVYAKTAGFNQKGMYFSNYFIRGYAIHGYASVPVYPASHGCLRVPIPNAVSIYSWVRFGDYVDVYYRTPGHHSPKPSPDAGP